MRAFLSAAGLILLLSGCAAEERPATPPADPAPADPAPTSPPAADTVATEPGPASQTGDVPANHDVTGAYFSIDPLPRDFAELEHLSLATIDENAAPAPLNGFLRPKDRKADDYVLVKPSLEGKRLTFVTTAPKGVQYAFDGEFTLLANFPENPPSYETVVLAGTLRRIRDGQTVASTPVRFRYEAGG